MSTQTLKDSRYNIIGYIETRSDGTQVGKDSHYNIKGYYDPKTSKTKDSHYNIVGEGNLLASLITSP
jgi:hypothetical protein